jgi:DNA modification methylase
LPGLEIGKGKRTDLTSVPENTGVKARDKGADIVGVSSSQIGKLLFIQKTDPHYIELIDEGGLTVSQAYLTVSRMKKQQDSLIEIKSRVGESRDDFVFHNKSSHKMDEVSDKSVDLIFTSPPYWNKRNYVEGGGLGNEKTDGEFVTNLVTHLGDCSRILKDDGSFFLVLGDTFHQSNLLNIPHRVALGLQEKGWLLRNTIVWKKTNPKPSSSKSNLSQTYEFIFHLVRSLGYKYQHTLSPMKHEYKVHASPRHRDMNPTKKKMYPYIPREGKNMGDYWSEDVVTSAVAMNVKSDGTLEHPAPFPENIVTLPILQTTNEGDLVLDPFMGTGTTGKVANRLGRRFVGYDLRVF